MTVTATDPAHDPAYRYLQVGEIIAAGDEWWFRCDHTWEQVGVTIGLDIDPRSVGLFRRRVT